MKRVAQAVLLAALLPSATPALWADSLAAVTIKEFKFQPQVITIKAGGTVRWTNEEKRQYHSVWFEQLGEAAPDYLFPGDSYERKFDTPGDFPYRCGPHPEMTGTVHVTP